MDSFDAFLQSLQAEVNGAERRDGGGVAQQVALESVREQVQAPAPQQAPQPVQAPALAPTLQPAPQPVRESVRESVQAPTLQPTLQPAPHAKPANRLRLLIVGTHLQQTTGYAKVMYGMLNALSAVPWIDITHYAIQRPPANKLERPCPSNVRVIDALSIETEPRSQRSFPPGFGFAQLPAVIRDTAPHIVLIYNDAMVIQEYIQEIRKAQIPRTFALWLYLDVVYPHMNPVFVDMMNRESDRIFCFTKGWREVMQHQGVTRPIDVMPHAFESQLFQPIAKHLAREAAKIPRDAFLIVSVNRNQPRKRLDLLVMAFTELIIKHPEKPIYLMCVCSTGQDGGYMLFEIFARELALRGGSVDHFGGRLLVASGDTVHTDEHINIMYNMADCGVSCAEGEGFGLCAFEQMGVGVPQVLSDVVGHREYCEHNRNGILVPVKTRTYLPSGHYPIGGEAGIVDYRDIANGIEQYLVDEQLRTHHGKAARETVLAYTWDRSLRSLLRRLRTVYEDVFEESSDE
jgi:glycosyltransferase involved in cell wall biosynthesis